MKANPKHDSCGAALGLKERGKMADPGRGRKAGRGWRGVMRFQRTRRHSSYGVDTTSATQENGAKSATTRPVSTSSSGYRFVGTDGNASMYDTLVNLQQGPRILAAGPKHALAQPRRITSSTG